MPISFAQVCSVAGLHHDGSWNAAYRWTGLYGIKSFTKPLLMVLRRTSEAFLGYVHFGMRLRLDPQITARAIKPAD